MADLFRFKCWVRQLAAPTKVRAAACMSQWPQCPCSKRLDFMVRTCATQTALVGNTAA